MLTESGETIVVSEKEAGKKTADLLMDVGVSPKLRGYVYLSEAIAAALKFGSDCSLSEKIYPAIGRRYGTSGTTVQKNIRTALQKAYKSKKLFRLNLYLGTQTVSEEYSLTNKEFIGYVREYLIRELIYGRQEGLEAER